MRFLFWNIRQGGGTRVPAIVDAIAASGADVAAVCEIKNDANRQVIERRLADLGLVHHQMSDPAFYRVLVASRVPLVPVHAPAWPDACRPAFVSVAVEGLHVLTAQFPARPPFIARAFEPLLAASEAWRAEGVPRLLLGDLNAGSNAYDTEGDPMSGSRNFTALLMAGWRDLWRAHHPTEREYTYCGRLGRGYRIDHALVQNWPDNVAATAHYDHSVRDAASDHSILLVDVAAAGTLAGS